MAHGGTNKYYDPADKIVNTGDDVLANDLNSINADVNISFGTVADDLDILEALVTGLSDEAHHWANYPVGVLVPEGNLVDEYSAYHYSVKSDDFSVLSMGYMNSALVAATESENWARYAEDTLVPEGNMVDQYSSFHYSRKSSGFADNAYNSSVAAANSATIAQGQNTLSGGSNITIVTTGTGPYNFEIVGDNEPFQLTRPDKVTVGMDVSAIGLVDVKNNFSIAGGPAITVISADPNMSANSDDRLVTQKAARAFIEGQGVKGIAGVAGSVVGIDNTNVQNPTVVSNVTTFVEVQQNTAQTLTTGAYNKLLFQNKLRDRLTEFSAATSIFTAAYAGYYVFSGGVSLSSGLASGIALVLRLYKNGAGYYTLGYKKTGTTNTQGLYGGTGLYLAAGDQIHLALFINQSGITTLTGINTYFNARRNI